MYLLAKSLNLKSVLKSNKANYQTTAYRTVPKAGSTNTGSPHSFEAAEAALRSACSEPTFTPAPGDDKVWPYADGTVKGTAGNWDSSWGWVFWWGGFYPQLDEYQMGWEDGRILLWWCWQEHHMPPNMCDLESHVFKNPDCGLVLTASLFGRMGMILLYSAGMIRFIVLILVIVLRALAATVM